MDFVSIEKSRYNKGRVSKYDDYNLNSWNGEHAYFYNKDIRTSVTNIVDETGAGIASYTYNDYGTTTKHGDQSFYNDICYTSGVYDELTGQYYLNARYYDPAMGTFITQDSYRGEMDESGTWNMYAYCGGNPINYVDPSGHKKSKIKKKDSIIQHRHGIHLEIFVSIK